MDSPPGIEFQGLLKGCNQVLHICRHIFVPAVYDRVIYDRFPVTDIKPAHRLVVVEMPDVALEIERDPQALRRQLGPRTDVLENCPKAAALLMLLRGMAPQVLAVDEITAPEDLRAIQEAAGCGVTLLATAHGGSWEELRLRPLYRELLDQGIFRTFVVLSLAQGKRVYTVRKEGMP